MRDRGLSLEPALIVCVLLMAARIAAGVACGAVFNPFILVTPAAFVLLSLVFERAGFRRSGALVGLHAMYNLGGIALPYWVAMCFHLGRSFPMADGVLAAIDEQLGFDWVGYLLLVDAHPWLNAILHPAYVSIFWQPFAIAMVLTIMGRETDAFEFVVAFTIAFALTILVAIAMPAYGAYHHYGVTALMHPNVTNLETGDGIAAALDWLREATMTGVLPDSRGGLITFPSFHAAAAVLFMWACRRVRWLFASSLLLNGVMLLATPLHGSHYLADIVVGAMVAALAALATRGIGALSRMPALLHMGEPDACLSGVPSR